MKIKLGKIATYSDVEIDRRPCIIQRKLQWKQERRSLDTTLQEEWRGNKQKYLTNPGQKNGAWNSRNCAPLPLEFCDSSQKSLFSLRRIFAGSSTLGVNLQKFGIIFCWSYNLSNSLAAWPVVAAVVTILVASSRSTTINSRCSCSSSNSSTSGSNSISSGSSRSKY